MENGFLLRRKELDVDDEDGLLLLQEEFLRAQADARPAAKATRITRKAPAADAAASKPDTAGGSAASASATHEPSNNRLPTHIANSAADNEHEMQQDGSSAASAAAQPPQQQAVAAAAGNNPSIDLAADEQPQPMCPSIPGILAEVKERNVSATSVPAVQPAAAAFPAAVHRKQSKFALGRRKQQEQQQQTQHPPAASTTQTAAAAAAGPTAPAATNRPSHTASTAAEAEQSRSAPDSSIAPQAAAATAAAAVRQEAAGVHESNLARLSEMTVEEVQEAQAELAARFSPAALAFLKNRKQRGREGGMGAKQQQQQQQQGLQEAVEQQQQQQQGKEEGQGEQRVQQQQQQQGLVPAAVQQCQQQSQEQQLLEQVEPRPGSNPTSAAVNGDRTTGRQQQVAKAAGGMKKGFFGSSAAAAARNPSQQQQQQQTPVQISSAVTKQPRNMTDKPVGQARHPAAAAAGAQQQPIERLPPVARLRFSLDGQVLELSDPNTPPMADEDVLMRDNISRAAGTVPQGYTLPEMRVLVRSRHAPQRAAGFRMLATVLCRAQPHVLDLGSDGQLIPQEVVLDMPQQQLLPPSGQQQQQQGGSGPSTAANPSGSSGSSNTGVLWHQIWEYAIVALRAVMLCRLGLDDENGQVLSAAAGALCVILGSSGSEMLVEEVAAATAAVSWPLGLRVGLRRLDKAGVWDQVTGLVRAAAAAQQQQGTFAPAADDADVDTPEDLAAIDPLAGFMATDPLPRIRFLLQNRADSTECVVPLLSVLEAIAASSSTAAESIVRCKGMPEALMSLLGLPMGKITAAAAGSSDQQQQQGGSTSSSSSKYGGFRVGALRLLRVVCAASPMACQLLRTAGLDSAVQLLLCTSGAAAAAVSGSSGSSSEVEQELMLLEALRIWRVSALHGVCLIHMDLMFQYIVVLLQPPLPAAAPGSSGSSSDTAQDPDTLTSLQWQLTGEAYQLVDTLVRHALAVKTGIKTLGSEMITPGCAAAIAQEAAAAWIQNPRMLRHIAQGLVSQADCALPFGLNPNARLSSAGPDLGFSTAESASSTAVWFRALPGMHPSLLVPQGFAVLAGFAAVLRFLCSYWCSLQIVPKQLVAELLEQLAAVGLAGSSSSSSALDGNAAGSTTRPPATAAAAAASAPRRSGSSDALATMLLSEPIGSDGDQQQQQPQQQWQQQLGAAVLQHCVHLLAAAQGPSSSSSRIIADHALGAAAAATLLATCQLQQQLCNLTQQQQQQQRCLDLAAQTADVLTQNMLHWVSQCGRTLVVDPWRLAQYTMRHYQIRTFLQVARLLLQQGLQDSLQERLQDTLNWREKVAGRVIDGLLCLLPLLGPGHEADALQALQLLFGGSTSAAQYAEGSTALPGQQQQLVAPLLAAAGEAVQDLLQQGGSLAAAAAGLRHSALPEGYDISKLPYAPTVVANTAAAAAAGGSAGSSEAQGIDPAVWCQTLLEGYAVTWLSVIAQEDGSSNSSSSPQNHQQGSDSSSSSSITKPYLALQKVYVPEVEGSRLPVPPEWFMSEILALPHHTAAAAAASSSGRRQQQRLHPVTAALLLAAGLERVGSSAGSSSSGYMKAIKSSAKLEALLNLLYLFNASELLPNASRQQQQQGSDAAAGLGLAWQQPDARWAAAVLTQQYVNDIVHNTAAAAGLVGSSGSSTAAGADCPIRLTLQPQQQQQQQQSSLLPTWAVAAGGTQLVDRLVTDLADISMGDPMFACHVALLLLPAAGPKLQRAVWGSLTHHACLHLLPKSNACIGGSAAYLGVQIDGPNSYESTTANLNRSNTSGMTSNTSPWKAAKQPMFDIHLVGDMAKTLAQGDLRKALKMGSVTGFMALHGIAAIALDQNAWSDNASSTAAAAAGSRSVDTEAMAVNVLRGVVRACSLEVLRLLVAAGEARGLAVDGMSRALVQCAHGDAQLMDKVAQLLSSMQ